MVLWSILDNLQSCREGCLKLPKDRESHLRHSLFKAPQLSPRMHSLNATLLVINCTNQGRSRDENITHVSGCSDTALIRVCTPELLFQFGLFVQQHVLLNVTEPPTHTSLALYIVDVAVWIPLSSRLYFNWSNCKIITNSKFLSPSLPVCLPPWDPVRVQGMLKR